MLRRLFILSICFLLFPALFAPTVQGQTTRIYHIGIPQTLNGQQNPNYKSNGTVEGNNYYFDSLEFLKASSQQYNFIQYDGAEIELILYSDQQIPNPSGTNEFYSIYGSINPTEEKRVTIRSGDGKPKTITSLESTPADADFLRIGSDQTNQKINLTIDSTIQIKAGSAKSSDRYATSIFGGNFTARGVTYRDGGPVVVTNVGNLYPIVDLNGATFAGNLSNPTSNDAILSLSNITSADLRNTNFNQNDAEWQVYVFRDSTSNTAIRLGATENETESVLGNTDNTRGGILLKGTGSAAYSVYVSGDGDFRQNQKIETDNINSVSVNKDDSGTWFIVGGITNKFHAQTNATLNINGGTLEIGTGSKMELHGDNNATMNLRENTILNMSDNTIFEVYGTNNTYLNLTNNELNTGNNSKFDVKGTNTNVTMTGSMVNIGNRSEFNIQGTNDTTFDLTDSVLNLDDNTIFNINGTNDINLNWNNDTVKMGKDSKFEIHGGNISLDMDGGTLEMGENAQYIAHSTAGVNNSITLSNNTKVDMGRGAKFILDDDTDTINNTAYFYARTTLNGGNEIKAENLHIRDTTFDIDAEALKYVTDAKVPVLTLGASSIFAGNTVFDIHGVHSNVKQLLVQNTGSATFIEANYSAVLDGVNINAGGSKRASAEITVEDNDKSLYLTVNFDNHILRWTGFANTNSWDLNENNNWRYEKNELSPADRYISSGYIFNDAVVFDDLASNNSLNIPLNIYISQQTDYLTDLVTQQQNEVTEYGMRVSGNQNWTFNGGSINDDFNPNPASTIPDQRKHIARLTFDGTGTIRLNNDEANKFHDGLLIGNDVTDGTPIQLRVARPDSLGSGEYAGETTDLDTLTGSKYIVQHEGYGIMFTGNGANIQIDEGNKPDEVMDQRIVVREASTGILKVNNTANETIVTASNSYLKNKDIFDIPITYGGVIVVEKNASFTMTGKFHFKDNNIFKNVANFDGGVLWADENTKVVMSRNSYSNNAAYRNGGVIYTNKNVNLDFRNSAFQNNEAGNNGGAIYLNEETLLNINNSSFINNLTHNNNSQGGAIYAGGNNITIIGTDSVFQNNMVGEDETGNGYQGGAIYLGDNGTLNMTSSVFRNNQVNTKNADSKGGAIYTGTGANINLSNGVLQENSAYSDGGAIYSVSGNSSSNGNLTIDGTRFIGNISETANGGAIFTGDTIIHGEGTLFGQNTANQNGGALYVFHANQTSSHIELINSQSVVVGTSNIDLIDSQFVQNFAENGGAIYLNATGFRSTSEPAEDFQLLLDVSGTQFLTNATYGNGGAIYAKTYTTVNAKSTSNGLRPTIFGTYITDSENDDPDDIIYGNVAGRHGGAIYIDGEVSNNKIATSELNVDNAFFQYNIAGADGNGNGGALYLRYADAEIANAVFYGNTAANGFGGGIYYENENGKELTLQSVQMDSETAKSGGAVYAATPTILKISDDSVFSKNEATQQDGGAVYFNSAKSQLDITATQFSNNIAKKNGGAVYLQNESIVKANGATFSSNKATNGGAIGIGSTAELYLSGSTFNNNTAIQNGGAIWINDTRKNLKASDSMSILEIDSSAFRNNEAFGNGGAIYAKNTEIISNDKGVTFSDNKADQNGGALYAENSDLNLINVTFFNNEAKKGGAIYFLINKDNVQDREITLTTTTNAVNYFTGNKSDDKANSIYFDVEAQDKISKISLNVKSDGILNMVDPMVVDIKNQNLDLDIVKSGSGKWSLGGTNDFSNTKTGTTFDVKSGIFELQNGSELLLTNNNDTGDYFKLYSGATFATTGPVTASAITNLKTTSLDFAVGSKMQLDGNLALNIENIYTIASTLSGSGGFTKQDDAVLTFSGITNNYNGNVTIEGGSFIIKNDVGVDGSGYFITEKGDFFMDRDTELKLHADLNQPSLVAKTVSIDKVYLDISGISSNDQQKEFILIHTTDGITGNFNTVNGKTETFASEVDYLTFSLGFLNDRKDYGGTIGLRWYSKNETLQASGVFTLPEEKDYFNVGVELHDNKTNLEDDWGGTTLDKYGLGTLELSATNTYSGKTTVHGGELLLTDKQGTGLGNAVVEVQRNTRLGLNFDGKYTKTITGMGQVIQHGGTVELTGNNTYTGGTVLKNGTMEFTADNQFGTGTITFDGGTLRNKAETSLKRAVLINDNKNAQFDTPLFSNDFKSSLTFNGTICGKGGLEKTGDGILTLTGKNTFEGTSYVRNGGLNIEGSVESDVRVQPFAAVSGSGNIKGDLFISRDGYFDWYFSPNQAASEPLNVTGSLYLAEGAVFRPRTDSANFTNQIVNWTVLTYGKTLGGQFLAVDDTFNAFYNFELDYSVKGEIRVNGELLSHPRALGDVVTTGLSIANRKLYRNAFIEMLRETMYRKTATRNGNGLVRGQAVQPTRSVWFTPSARANRFASTFVGGIYDFEAYGMQTGSTFWSNNNSSLGLMIGYERGALRNRLDWIRSHDYQIGLYFGHIFRSGSEFRSFIGGGFQTFTASRNDMVETYMTKYDGSSFEINTEFGKLFAGQNGTLFRPYFAVDIEYSGQTAAQEKEIGNAFRHYGRADLSQFFVRFGADVEKRWQYVDINGGASYTGLLFGQTRAQAPIFYPTRGAGTTSYGARLGRSSITLKTGLNWHLNRQRVNTIFLDYFADIYLDRTGKVADTMQHSGNLGILVRF